MKYADMKPATLELKNKILGLKKLGLYADQIIANLGISRAKYVYILYRAHLPHKHLSPEKIEKREADRIKRNIRSKEWRARRKLTPSHHIQSKINNFISKNKCDKIFTVQDVLDKFGAKPVCYLTGMVIDYADPKSYSFDHYIPLSKGGDSNLNNLRLCHPIVNYMKFTSSHAEFVEWCQKVVDWNNKNIGF